MIFWFVLTRAPRAENFLSICVKSPPRAGWVVVWASPRPLEKKWFRGVVLCIIKFQRLGIFAVSAPDRGLVGCLGTLCEHCCWHMYAVNLSLALFQHQKNMEFSIVGSFSPHISVLCVSLARAQRARGAPKHEKNLRKP